MTIRLFAVIDADGFKVNTILIDDEKLDGYYPGYGAKLIDEGPQPEEPKAPPLPERPADFGVLKVALAEPMLVGDKIDFKTGIVTKRKEDISISVDPIEVDPIEVQPFGR